MIPQPERRRSSLCSRIVRPHNRCGRIVRSPRSSATNSAPSLSVDVIDARFALDWPWPRPWLAGNPVIVRAKQLFAWKMFQKPLGFRRLFCLQSQRLRGPVSSVPPKADCGTPAMGARSTGRHDPARCCSLPRCQRRERTSLGQQSCCPRPVRDHDRRSLCALDDPYFFAFFFFDFLKPTLPALGS
jgi:hypothetical protein